MQPGWKQRGALWALLMESARANRRAYPSLPTAWLPHTIANSVALWLPELLVLADRACSLEGRCHESATARGSYETVRGLCVDNGGWGWYVAPAALGYIVSHPGFNIYKGDLGELRLAGFGLDAIPHSVTAYALARLVQDGIVQLAANLPTRSPVAGLARTLARRPTLVSAAVLAALTALWESGEMAVQRAELRRMGGDASAINMEWSLENTLYDALANALGWAVAAWQGTAAPQAEAVAT